MSALMCNLKKTILLSAGFCMLAACSTPRHKLDSEATSSARISATPNAAPQRTITNFTESLRCMDSKLAEYEISNLLIGAQEVADHSSEVSGTKDMLLTSLSTMSRKSKAFKVVTLSSDLGDVTNFHKFHSTKLFQAPDFFIRLSTPQIDKGVQFNQISGGLRVEGAFGAEHSRDRIASVVSLDMNLGQVRNLQLLPGIYSSNSIAVIRKGQATDVSGEIRKMGAVFRIANDNSEGFHHSVRTLIELGAIELVGRLTQIPYWECLDIEATNPSVQVQVQDWYDSLSDEELVTFAQTKLTETGHYTGEVDGIESPDLRRAIATYKSENELIADGKLDYMFYYKLVVDPTPFRSNHLSLLNRYQQEREQEASAIIASDGTDDRVEKLEFDLKTDHGASPVVYRSGEDVNLMLNTTVDTHVYCYYQQGDGKVVKIFPNRFRPSSKVIADKTIEVPGTDKFEIRADQSGVAERVMCLASYSDIDKKLPFQLREKDLQPLPVKDLEQIYSYYKGVADIAPLRRMINIEVQ